MKEEGTYVGQKLDIVSVEEFVALIEYRRYNCSTLSWTCEMINGDAYNYLIFNHIEPIHGKVEHNKESFGIGNIQPLCKALNCMKRNLDNNELYRWLIFFLRSYYHCKFQYLFYS